MHKIVFCCSVTWKHGKYVDAVDRYTPHTHMHTHTRAPWHTHTHTCTYTYTLFISNFNKPGMHPLAGCGGALVKTFRLCYIYLQAIISEVLCYVNFRYI